jgi:hypothetical protein
MANIEQKQFTDVLSELDRGEVVAELTKQLYAVVEGIKETHKPGSVGVTLGLSMTGRGSLTVVAKVSSKVPEVPPDPTTFFVDEDGTLMRDDPKQPRLPLGRRAEENQEPARRIDEDRTPMRVVGRD